MPIGNPKPQTIATEKYIKKVGLISKAYKLKADLVKEFAKACEQAGTNQSAQISKMMREFIEDTHKEQDSITESDKPAYSPYTRIIQEMNDESGHYFYGRILELDGCQSTGETIDELLISLDEALEGYIQVRKEYK